MIYMLYLNFLASTFYVNARGLNSLNYKETHVSIAKRSDGLARDLVDILVEEKQERKKLREENRMMKKTLDNVLRELRDRNELLGDIKFQRQKLIEEVKGTKAELKSELEKEIGQHIVNINQTISSIKSETDSKLKQAGDKMGDLVGELKKDGDQMKKKLANMKSKVKALAVTNGDGGAVYIRWGKKSCPGNTTDIVYNGQLGGPNYQSKGGPSNYLCLPDDPDWRLYKAGVTGYSTIIGGEYEVFYLSEGELLDKNKYYNHEILCSVCQSREQNTAIMILGKSKCYDGLHLEYRGYLMSGAVSHAPSQYICVDANPDAIPGSNSKDKNGAVIYAVEAGCTNMKCPPYVSGRELTCVVCTK